MAFKQLVSNESESKRLSDIPLIAEYLKHNEPPKNGAFNVTRIIEPATYDNYTIVVGDDLCRANVYPSNPVYQFIGDNVAMMEQRQDALFLIITNRVKGFWTLSEDDEMICDWSNDKLGFKLSKPKKRKAPASVANLANHTNTKQAPGAKTGSKTLEPVPDIGTDVQAG